MSVVVCFVGEAIQLLLLESRRTAELWGGIGRPFWPWWLGALLLCSCEAPMASQNTGVKRVESCGRYFRREDQGELSHSASTEAENWIYISLGPCPFFFCGVGSDVRDQELHPPPSPALLLHITRDRRIRQVNSICTFLVRF